MTQLEKILKRREEEKQRKLERERKRAEKKAEKERLKKITFYLFIAQIFNCSFN